MSTPNQALDGDEKEGGEEEEEKNKIEEGE